MVVEQSSGHWMKTRVEFALLLALSLIGLLSFLVYLARLVLE